MHLFSIKFQKEVLRLDAVQNKLYLTIRGILHGSKCLLDNIFTDMSFCHDFMVLLPVINTKRKTLPHDTTSIQTFD